MMLMILAESALRSLLLGCVVWVGLNLLRVRNPHVHMTSWALVLAASLSMPLLMHWTTVTITLDAPSLPAPASLWPESGSPQELAPSSLAAGYDVATMARVEHHHTVNWWLVATAIYAAVAGLLLLRLLVGIHLTWRLTRAAEPMYQAWTAGADVRVSDLIGGPVTFASTILLPPQCFDWDPQKRGAVLAHEGAHVANRDFYILLLASLNRAVFWFSPFAWWQLTRLAELAEIISDARALETLEDRLTYAQILLDLVQSVRQAPAGLAMARACTVRARVERILSLTALPAKAGWRKRTCTAAAILPVVLVSATSIAYGTRSMSTPAADAMLEAQRPQFVGFYAAGPASVLAISRQGDEIFGQLTGQRKLQLAVTPDGIYSYPAGGGQISFAKADLAQPSSELMLHQNGRGWRAARLAEVPQQPVVPDIGRLDSYVGWYALGPNRMLTITRDGNRLLMQETGRGVIAVTTHGPDAFYSNRNDLLVFLRDGQARVDKLLFEDPTLGARVAQRIDAAKARVVTEAFARQIAQAPDRFRDQAPAPGSKDAILRGIEGMQRGSPDYDRMRPALADAIRRQLPQLQRMFSALGAMETIFFRGVGPGGYDIYGVKFANGFAEFRIQLGADGIAEDVLFRPDGNDTPGRMAACPEEAGLRSHGDTAPIRLQFYNDSGRDIQLYELDAEGKRLARKTIGDETTAFVLTYVDTPWVVADTSGQCREIVLPGQHTRFHAVERFQAADRPARSFSTRAAPLAGSEELLRNYIEAVGRGEPDYDRMTPEVAAQTRRNLALDRAILTRLGPLRAVSFRGVTPIGSDVYMAHFANGSAEWRIALVRDGVIGRIALGPQS
jgi:beta-lactamase regulating signal transducer with metallopeptidase domain